MKKKLFFSLLLLVGGISFANAQSVTNEPQKVAKKSDTDLLDFLRNLNYGVAVQTQWQYVSEKGLDVGPNNGGAFSPNANNRFMLRRGYLRLGYDSKYFATLVQINAVPTAVSLVNAYVQVNTASKSVALRVGNIYKHFGYFTHYSSSSRLTPEVTQGEQSLFINATGVGARLQLVDMRDKWTRNFTLNLQYYSGYNNASDTYAGGDFIGKLEYAKPVGQFVLGGQVSALFGYLVNVSDKTYSFGNGSYFAKDDVAGKNNYRQYYSIGGTVALNSCAGRTELYGEYMFGNQLASATSNYSPARNFKATTLDPLYKRNFSNYYIFAEHRITDTNLSVIARFDGMNPNRKISREEIGVAQGSSAADVKYTNVGIGAYYRCFKYVSVSAFYEIMMNEKCPNLAGFEKDRKDNVLTIRLQCKF